MALITDFLFRIVSIFLFVYLLLGFFTMFPFSTKGFYDLGTFVSMNVSNRKWRQEKNNKNLCCLLLGHKEKDLPAWLT